jgi:hypothetical protein
MSKIRDLLYSFVYSPTAHNRLALADEYFIEKQYAVALTFYLKTAEVTDNKNIQYYCLIMCGKCMEIAGTSTAGVGNRKHSVMTIYKHAINEMPERPEAYYYLSRTYELYNDWFDTYLFAQLALQKPSIDDNYSRRLNYPANYGPLFQKAISAWHIGKGSESRILLQELKNKYYDIMDSAHKTSVDTNIARLNPST